MGKSIMITSFKGGVGKSTVSVNLAIGFAVNKYKVLIIDLDASSGSIDLFMGCESNTLYNFCDVIEGKVKIEDAVYSKNSDFNPNKKDNIPGEIYYSVDVLKSPSYYEAEMLTASTAEANDLDDSDDLSSPDNMDNPEDSNNNVNNINKEIGRFITNAKNLYDFIIFDCPPGRFAFFDGLIKHTDFIFVITLHSAASIRSSEKIALFLSEKGSSGENVRLIINCFNPAGIAKGFNLGIVDIIERSKIKLIGLIEINNLIRDYQELGKTVYDVKSKKLRSFFDDIIGRILESNIILNKRYNGIKTNTLYFKNEEKNKIKFKGFNF